MRNLLLVLISLVLIAGASLACPSEPEPAPVEPSLPRTGAWVDEVIITMEGDRQAAVLNMRSGVTDIYDPLHTIYYDSGGWRDYLEFIEQVREHPEVDYVLNYGSYRDLRFNTYRDAQTKEPFFDDGRLNPFAIPEIREAMNWLIDRHHIVDEYQGGIGSPKWTALGTQYPDHRVRYPHIVAAIEAYYTHDPEKAAGIIGAEMEKLGAEVVDGKWQYQDEPVEIIVLIRAELPPFPAAGHYVADLMEGLGFAVVRLVLSGSEASQIWVHTHPGQGAFHIYTGGWGTTMISRDQGSIFDQMYTHRLMPIPLWGVLEEQLEEFPTLRDASGRLRFLEFTAMEEREELFATVLWEAMRFSNCIWITDFALVSLLRHDVGLAVDANLGALCPMWAYTVHFQSAGEPVAVGTLRVEMAEMLRGPWNPVAGSSARVDRFAGNWALGDRGTLPDTRDGLCWPQRIERAEVYVEQGLPVDISHDWLTLEHVLEIEVPLDAWGDWDARTQEFLTVQDRFGSGGATARTKSVSYYPKEIFQIPLHDGSTLSMGDFILYTILQFDRAKPASAIYDDSAVGAYNSLMSHFKGVKFVTDNPDYGLIVEYYSDQWQLDAELMVNTMFPYYAEGPGMWHTISLGIRAEQDGALAFSQAKANMLGVEWISFVTGPSLPFLRSYLTSAKATNYIPYAPTMGLYVSQAEAVERWSNLEEWYADKGHVWVGSGPFYLESVDTTAKIIHLKRFSEHPDPSDKWLFLLEPLP